MRDLVDRRDLKAERLAAMTTTRLAGRLHLVEKRPVVSTPIRLQLIVANESGEPLTIVDPEVGIPPPDLHWTASAQAYRIGVLSSFGLIQIALKDQTGGLVAGKAPVPWVTPLLGQRLLQPRASLAIEFDLNELFVIDSPGNYRVSARYGDEDTSARAEMSLEILPIAIGVAP